MFLNCDLQFNFVGKLLGPKGNSLKRLQEETMCKMSVLGRGSMRDRKKVKTKRDFLRKKGKDRKRFTRSIFHHFLAGRRTEVERWIQIFTFIRGSACWDTNICSTSRSSRPNRLRPRRSQTLLSSGKWIHKVFFSYFLFFFFWLKNIFMDFVVVISIITDAPKKGLRFPVLKFNSFIREE